ncbi:UNKNOWN [Stylonychia lemnae]|uniref:Uncharacterized protein n=1 Tax=Stylonychia lemnae TaxID=5949 RepID=A0A078AJS2_STYLE|nr:UNKNOWN [Stylonychia lemnae]|eukprot:CDW82630.1 UNKNOWN [Stylonychia lemnae]
MASIMDVHQGNQEKLIFIGTILQKKQLQIKAKAIPPYEFQFDQAYLQLILSRAKIFVGYNILNMNEGPALLLAHGKFISVFSVDNQKWVNHVEFESDIQYLIRHKSLNGGTVTSILLHDGSLYCDLLTILQKVQKIEKNLLTCKINGKIMRYTADTWQYLTLYANIMREKQSDIICIVQGKEQVIVENTKSTAAVALLKVSNDSNLRLVIQIGNEMTIYLEKVTGQEVKLEQIRKFKDISSFILHSALSYDINDHLVFFDKTDCFLIKFHDEEKDEEKKYEWIRDTKKYEMGCQTLFEWGKGLERLTFLNSVTTMIITPILHLNENKLMGIPIRNFISQKIIGDQIIKLELNGEIYSWNIFTGKFLKKSKILNFDIPKYAIPTYQQNDLGKTLMKSREQVTVEKDKEHEFFLPCFR